MSTEAQTDTIFDRIGGEPAVAAVVDIFYAKVLADADLAPYFANSDVDQLKQHQRLFVGQALGARRPYSGKSMEAAHAGRNITDAAFGRVVEHLAASLKEAGVDDETIGQIAGALAPLQPAIVTA